MEENNMQCHNCRQEIEESICERCRMREMASWLQDNNVPWPFQVAFFRTLEKELPKPVFEGFCLLCYNERPALCESCFQEKVRMVLRQVPSNKILLGKFERMFSPWVVQHNSWR